MIWKVKELISEKSDLSLCFKILVFEAMHRTTADLISNFHATTGYTQSDEITLIFPPTNQTMEIEENNEQKEKEKEKERGKEKEDLLTIIHNGKIQTLVSLVAR